MVKIVSICIICACVIIFLKTINPELALLATVGSGIIILILGLKYLSSTFDFIERIINLTGIDKDLYVIILKITAIGYIVEFGASTLNDFGLNSLSLKLIFIGKLIIFSVSMPIFYAIFNILLGLF